MYLAIDTSTDLLGLALLDDSGLVGELSWRTSQNHTAELIPSIRYLLGRAKTELQHLKGIVVARGPGGFTGLRVGMTTAKGFAISWDIPIAGISSLEAWAYPYLVAGTPVCSVLEIGRGEVATGLFDEEEGWPRPLLPEHITTVGELCLQIQEPVVFCGQISQKHVDELRARFGARIRIAETGRLLSPVASVAALGRRRLQRGDADDPASLQPLYLRRPSITRPSTASKP